MKKILLSALILLFIVAQPQAQVINTISQGSYNSFGYIPNPSTGYLVGNTAYGSVINRAYFVFNLPSLTLGQTITSSTLSIYDPSGGIKLNGYQTAPLNVYGFTGNPSDLVDGTGWWSTIYADLANGTLYGTTTLNENLNNTVYNIQLNAEGLTAINQQSGGYFALGITLPVASINSDFQYEYAFQTPWYMSRSTAGDGSVQMAIITVPEPSIYTLLGFGALAMIVACRRKKTI